MQFEVDIIVGLQKVASEGLTVFFQLVSLLGSYLGFIILFIAFFFLNRRLAYVFGITFIGGVGLNYILKHLINRPRPFVSYPEILNLSDTLGKSMPSSHALCSVVLGIFLCYFVFKLTKNIWARGGAIAFSSVLIILTCTSRLYLGMHYLTDLFVGVIIGAVISTIAILYIEKRKKKVGTKNTF